MKKAALIGLLALTSCYPGDSETHITNAAPRAIVVTYYDEANKMAQTVTLKAHHSDGLWPNGELYDLLNLHVKEGDRTYDLEDQKRRDLEEKCERFCTLIYKGQGRFDVRKWQRPAERNNSS